MMMAVMVVTMTMVSETTALTLPYTLVEASSNYKYI